MLRSFSKIMPTNTIYLISNRLSHSSIFNRKDIKIYNTDIIPDNYDIHEHIGLVSGSVVKTKNIFHDVFAEVKSVFGGELTNYTDLLSDARKISVGRMATIAKNNGANAIINVRLTTNNITDGTAEIMAYGTAVVLKENNYAKNDYSY